MSNTDIIEAGAGIGLISMYLKKNKKKLIMIEPNIKMNSIINENFILNNFQMKILLLKTLV